MQDRQSSPPLMRRKTLGKKKIPKGYKKNRLTVIEKAPRRPGVKNTYYLCLCDCGNTTEVRADIVISGRTKSCGCYHREAVAKSNKERRSYKTIRKSAIAAVRNGIKQNAKRRNIYFGLTYDEVGKIIDEPCFYCGRIAVNNQVIRHGSVPQEYRYNGIDRVDNNIGYVMGNCVSCCKYCNHAKTDMELSDFLDWIELVYQNTRRFK